MKVCKRAMATATASDERQEAEKYRQRMSISVLERGIEREAENGLFSSFFRSHFEDIGELQRHVRLPAMFIQYVLAAGCLSISFFFFFFSLLLHFRSFFCILSCKMSPSVSCLNPCGGFQSSSQKIHCSLARFGFVFTLFWLSCSVASFLILFIIDFFSVRIQYFLLFVLFSLLSLLRFHFCVLK